MKPLANVSESVRVRLLGGARERGEDFQRVLTRYAMERVLYRLSQSAFREHFVLKGAALYALWTQEAVGLRYRPTRDLDFWGQGDATVESLVAAFQEVLVTPVPPDGLQFPVAEVRGQIMRENERYPGCRLFLLALLGNARIPLHVDFGFGDAITPAAVEAEYPVLLATVPAPRLRIYPRETVVAEKFEALVSLGMANTRMKDFFDLWMLSEYFSFEGKVLRAAIQATFARRNTALPREVPMALTPAFTQLPDKLAAWRTFGKRNELVEIPELVDVAARLTAFLMPSAMSIREGRVFERVWQPGQGY